MTGEVGAGSAPAMSADSWQASLSVELSVVVLLMAWIRPVWKVTRFGTTWLSEPSLKYTRPSSSFNARGLYLFLHGFLCLY